MASTLFCPSPVSLPPDTRSSWKYAQLPSSPFVLFFLAGLALWVEIEDALFSFLYASSAMPVFPMNLNRPKCLQKNVFRSVCHLTSSGTSSARNFRYCHALRSISCVPCRTYPTVRGIHTLLCRAVTCVSYRPVHAVPYRTVRILPQKSRRDVRPYHKGDTVMHSVDSRTYPTVRPVRILLSHTVPYVP